MNVPKNKTFAVIGRGIAGLTAAYALQKAGYHPTVFGSKADQASRAAQGILCNKGLIFSGSPLFKAKLASLDRMQRFLDELEQDSGKKIPRHFSGVHEPYWSSDDFQSTVTRVYRHKFWGCHGTRDEPSWRAFPETSKLPLGRLFYPNDGWYEPTAALEALESYLCDRGILFQEDVVSGFSDGANDSIIILTNDNQSSSTFDRVILATGAGSRDLWDKAGLKPEKMFFIGGQTLRVPRSDNNEPQILVKGNRSLTLFADQAILGSSSWKDFESDDLAADQAAILRETEEQFGLAFKGEVESRSGVRFRFKDRMPLVGWVSTGKYANKIYLMTGFYKNGMHLAATCADEMLLDIANRGEERLYPEFSPLRFSV